MMCLAVLNSFINIHTVLHFDSVPQGQNDSAKFNYNDLSDPREEIHCKSPNLLYVLLRQCMPTPSYFYVDLFGHTSKIMTPNLPYMPELTPSIFVLIFT